MPAGQQKMNDKEESIIAEHNSTCEFRHSPLRLTIPHLVLLDCSGRISESTPAPAPEAVVRMCSTVVLFEWFQPLTAKRLGRLALESSPLVASSLSTALLTRASQMELTASTLDQEYVLCRQN